MRRLGVVVTAIAGAGALVAALAVATFGASGATRELLPDLDAVAPGMLDGETVGTGAGRRFLLGFESAAENVGEGPLIIEGRRARAGTMRASQVVMRSDRSRRRYGRVGVIRYTRSSDHRHWHLLGFMRYTLERAGDAGDRPRRDRKTGFCLGDRYSAPRGPELENTPRRPVFTEECGRGRPGLKTLREGISVGYGDDYRATLEGQVVDLTGLAAGRYVLVHRVNETRALRESSYANNASSLVLDLTWPRGPSAEPTVEVLARCGSSAECKAPPDKP